MEGRDVNILVTQNSKLEKGWVGRKQGKSEGVFFFKVRGELW